MAGQGKSDTWPTGRCQPLADSLLSLCLFPPSHRRSLTAAHALMSIFCNTLLPILSLGIKPRDRCMHRQFRDNRRNTRILTHCRLKLLSTSLFANLYCRACPFIGVRALENVIQPSTRDSSLCPPVAGPWFLPQHAIWSLQIGCILSHLFRHVHTIFLLLVPAFVEMPLHLKIWAAIPSHPFLLRFPPIFASLRSSFIHLNSSSINVNAW